MKPFAVQMLLVIATLTFAGQAHGNHPGEKLDERMSKLEQYFQAIDAPAPGFALADAKGEPAKLADLGDSILILHFIYARCPHVCPLHAEKVAEVQSLLNQSPMKDFVRFITVTTDPESDTPDVMNAYGQQHGLDPYNWHFLTKQPSQPDDVTRRLAQDYGLEFTQTEENLQMHGVVTFVIDRNGRLAAKFHGLEFDPLNIVLYVNGLLNKASSHDTRKEPTWWETLWAVFE